MIIIIKIILTIIVMGIITYFGCKHGYNRGRNARLEYERTGEISDPLLK